MITDQVFEENPEYSSKKKLIAEIIVILQIKSEKTGHADGMVRFVDRTTVRENNQNVKEKGNSLIIKF